MSGLFCRIVEGSIPSTEVYQDEQCYAFRDIDPRAPVHVLVVPRKHIASLEAADAEDSAPLGTCCRPPPKLRARTGLRTGYRVVISTGKEGGQTVNHLHLGKGDALAAGVRKAGT